MIKKKCLNCKKEMFVTANRQKYCSSLCANTANKMYGKDNPRYGKGKGWFKDVDGYIQVYIGNRKHPRARKGMVYQHILVMEKSINRYLKPKEVVHHRNGIRDDNRIENLELFKNNGEHMAKRHLKKGYPNFIKSK